MVNRRTGPAVLEHQPALVAARPQGLTRDLPLMLFADAMLLAAALVVWSLKGTLPEAFAGLGILAGISLGLIITFGIRYWSDINCQAYIVMQAGWAYWYLVPMLLTSIRGKVYLDQQERDFTAGQIAQACAAVLLVKFCSTLVYELVRARPVLNLKPLTDWLNHRQYPLPLWPVALLFGLGLIPFLLSGRPLVEAILSSRSAGGVFPVSNFSGLGGSWFALTFLLTSCCLIGFCRFLLQPAGLSKWAFLTLGLLALTVWALAVSTRTMLLASVMPVLTLYLLGSPDRWRLLKVGGCLFGLWISADLLVSSRQQGFLQDGKGHQTVSRNLVDNDFFSELLFVISAVPQQVPYSDEGPLAYAAMSMIPRAIWHNKPNQEKAEKVMRLRLNGFTAELTGNMLPGLVGQYWEVHGWMGMVVLSLWLGAAMALMDWFIVLSNWQIRYCAFAFLWAIFISFRTFALSSMLPSMIAAAIILVLSRKNRIESY